MLNFFLNQSINKYQKTIREINTIYNKLRSYSNEELKNQTGKLKKIIQNKDLESILVEAFGTVKEAISRATDITLFDEQLLGGIILHKGNIAEMKTGEGKTLAALLPAYLNSLRNEGVHIITVNDYLAQRDASLAQNIFSYLDIKIGVITQDKNYNSRKKEYNCDITYLTNSELGFDYLKDNMAIHQNDIVQRHLNYAIIDEIDSIFIDEARTPLIISGDTKVKEDLYHKAQKISNILRSEIDYKIDEKSRNITLTEEGVSLCEEILDIENLYNVNSPWIKYIINSLKAKELFLRNKDYIVKNNQIIIVDEFTGRIMEGRRWSDGLHQSIEAKENLRIEAENQTLASITYQNLFYYIKKLSGMTGTAKTEENEFLNIYKIQVVEIPTHKKCIRKDLPDLVYRSEYSKWQAITNECLDMYKIGRPTLIGTTSIEKSELLANMLKTVQVPYKLLNAKPENVYKEAEIIAQAGKKHAITISTNMAGRGTDIILGGNVKQITKLALEQYINKNIIRNNELSLISDIKSIEEILNEEEIKLLKTYISKIEPNQKYNFNLDLEKVKIMLQDTTYTTYIQNC